MSLKARITEDMKAAMKAKETARLGAIRLLLAAIKQKEVDERVELDDAAVVAVIEKMLKQRKDSITQYEAAKRQDLADAEKAEVAVLTVYMPQALSAAEVESIVAKAVAVQPSARYQNVMALEADVHGFLRGGLHLPRKAFNPGDVIMREGEKGDAAYMIVSGNCRAFRTVGAQVETLATMGPGDVFGEMALLLDEPRAASVAAVDRVIVLVLDKQTLNEELGLDGWAGALVRALAQRFYDLEQRVRASGLKRG